MFDHYIELNAGDPRWRRATGLSAVISGSVTAVLLGGVWLHETLAIERVDPPTHAVTIVQMMMEEDTVTPPPPPPPAAGSSADANDPSESVDPRPSDPDPVPDEEAPLEQPDPDRATRRSKPAAANDTRPAAQTKGIPGGVPGGDPMHGMPGGVGIRGIPGVLGARGAGTVSTKREPVRAEAVAKQPLQTVKRNALHAPDCDAKRLARTKAALFDHRGGHTKVSFCVDALGKTVDIRTTHAFGDAEVDRICRDTVQSWRFQPFLVDGKAIKTCSAVDFVIEFE